MFIVQTPTPVLQSALKAPQSAGRAKAHRTHVRSLSSIASFLFLRRWWWLTSRMTSTISSTRPPAAPPMMISIRLCLPSSSLCLDCPGGRCKNTVFSLVLVFPLLLCVSVCHRTYDTHINRFLWFVYFHKGAAKTPISPLINDLT